MANHKQGARTNTGYHRVKAWGHPLQVSKDGYVMAHRILLFDRIGAGVHHCHHCACELEWGGTKGRRLVVDHLDDDRTNNHPSNLVPSCSGCNSLRTAQRDAFERRRAA